MKFSGFVQKWGDFGERVIKWAEVDKYNKRRRNSLSGIFKQLLLLLIFAHLWMFLSNCYGILMVYFPRIVGSYFLLCIISPIAILLLSPLCFFIEAISSKSFSRQLCKTGLFFSVSCLVISFLTFPFTSDGPIIPLSSLLKNKFITEKTELPLSEPEGIAVDSEGRIYLAIQIYSRVQVYLNSGEFINGWNVDAAGGVFNIWVEDDGIHTATARTDRHDVFTPRGESIFTEEIKSFEHSQALWKKSDGLATFDSKGVYYEIKNPLWKPKIVRTEATSTDQRILIQDPVYIWIHQSPQPVWLIGLGSIIMVAIFSLAKKLIC
ncbi:MAG: hypothetical protein OEV87_05715 [Phycisphaerae bacterium]|nr:hypothetical protein [Phycisphaerae bacterium]